MNFGKLTGKISYQTSVDKHLECIDFIVEKAMEFKLGARGLRSICEAVINDAMFELPSEKNTDRLVINRAYAEEKFNKSQYSKLKVA